MATTTYGTPYVSGTDLVANWPAASLTVANSIDEAGYYVGRGTNTQTGSYTLVLTDAGKNITMALNTATTITIPTNSSVAFPIGTRVNIINLGAGACTPTAAGGVTIAGTITALAINEYASLVKTGTNVWSYLAAATPSTPGSSLVIPTSVAGTGVTLSGGAVSFTTTAAASVNGCFTSTYQNYQIVISVLGSLAASNDLSFRMRAAGTDLSGAVYTTSYIYNTQAGGPSRSYTSAGTSAGLGYTNDYLSLVQTYIGSPFAADRTAMTGTHMTLGSGAASQSGHIGIVVNNATSYDGFTLIQAGGTITGTLRVYGLRNS